MLQNFWKLYRAIIFQKYREYTRNGCRVLAMASKKLKSNFKVSEADQESLEQGLTFAGFIVFNSQLKKGTRDTIVNLIRSTHRVMILTGDDPLTACHVGTELKIITTEAEIHDIDVTDSFGQPLKDGPYSLCYTGKAIQKLDETELKSVVSKCNIFARMSPNDKSLVIRTLKENGEFTMMTGDGTNDVGALKQAHVGVGLLENSLNIEMKDEEYQPKLGAASIAAPFVSKRPTISSCIDIIRFGRATLSSTMDLFKILSLSSLISAYSMSALFIENVKFGDFQITVVSIFIACSFMALNWAKPIRKLSEQRPFQTQFNLYLVVTVLIQFGIHIASLIFVGNLVHSSGYKTPPFDYKIEFSPNLMNTAMFLLTTSMQLSTFVANYRGKPFMQSFIENRLMFWSVLICGVIISILTSAKIPEFNEYMQLVPFPSNDFHIKLVLTLIIDFVLVIGVDKICLLIFNPQRKSKYLVDPIVLDSLKNYEEQKDDELDEEKHKFGLIDMFKANFALQKKMALQSLSIRREKGEPKKLSGLQKKIKQLKT